MGNTQRTSCQSKGAEVIKVAILGAPGVGKSDIASRIARSLNRDKTGHHWVTIDGYVDKLAKRTGREYGFSAGYEHNAQVMCERWTLEAEALNKGHHTITCGTIYETLVYAAMISFKPPETEQEIVTQQLYTNVAMQFFGMIESTTFNYDAMFYIPRGIEDHTWDEVLDAKIPEVLEGQFKFALELKGTPRKKATNALETIRLIRNDFDIPASGTPEAVRQRVQRDPDSGSDEEDQPEALPNL